MEQTMEEKIVHAAMEEFNLHGVKFTMDQVAKRLGMSKKTIYTVVEDKKALILQMIDVGFAEVKESERRILEDDSLTTVEKIRAVIIVIPERYRAIDFSKLYELKEKYPKLYQKVEGKLNSGWEPTLTLLQGGIREGKIKNIRLPVLKEMISGSIEKFLSTKEFAESGIGYTEALEEMIGIIMDGITAKEGV